MQAAGRAGPVWLGALWVCVPPCCPSVNKRMEATDGTPRVTSALGTPIRSRMSKFARDKGILWGEVDDEHTLPALHKAASCGDCESLLASRDLNCRRHVNAQVRGLTPLLRAARAGHMKAVSLLLQHSADVNATAAIPWARAWSVRAPAIWCAVHCAVHHGDADLLCLLLDHRAEIDAKATCDVRPLHLAASRGRLECGQLLIARRADMHAYDEDGYTALDDAFEARTTARLGAKCGCPADREPEMVDWRGRIEALASLLEQVSAQDMTAAQRWRVAQQAYDVSTTTRLLDAAERGDSGSLTLQLSRGGKNVNCRDVDGATPLHLTCEDGHWEAATALLDCGSAVDARNNSGDTPLHTAAHRGHARLVLLLCLRGAVVHPTNRYGVTPREMVSSAMPHTVPHRARPMASLQLIPAFFRFHLCTVCAIGAAARQAGELDGHSRHPGRRTRSS